MASPVNAVLCALLATVFWTGLGYALGRHLLTRALAVGAAPVIGWAVHSAASLPMLDRQRARARLEFDQRAVRAL